MIILCYFRQLRGGGLRSCLLDTTSCNFSRGSISTESRAACLSKTRRKFRSTSSKCSPPCKSSSGDISFMLCRTKEIPPCVVISELSRARPGGAASDVASSGWLRRSSFWSIQKLCNQHSPITIAVVFVSPVVDKIGFLRVPQLVVLEK
jgi:hypothetical protein